MKLNTILGAAIATLSIGALAAPAHSTTYLDVVPLAGGPFSGTNPIGAFPVMALEKTKVVTVGKTKVTEAVDYDFTFTLDPPIVGGTDTQVQAQAQNKKGVGSPELIQFSLYSGTPTGTHSFIANSPLAYSSFLTLDLAPGNYFVQITPADIAVNGEVDSGSLITAPVPEPASWALVILGAGAVGGALRGRRRETPVQA